MKGLLKIMLNAVGIKKLLGLVWEMADVELKKYVAKTDNDYDDTALLVVEKFIRGYLES
jgi:hypothetical protein